MAMLEKGINVPQTTSLGRLFDAAAALLGIVSHNRFEAEAAMRLESLATPLPCLNDSQRGQLLEPLPEPFYRIENKVLDLSPLLLSLVEENDPERGAMRFHQGLALALADWTIAEAKAERIGEIALSGGCLQNALLSRLMVACLEQAGLKPLLPQAVPPGDGGLALGQAWIARELARK